MPFNQEFKAVKIDVTNIESIKVGLSVEEIQQIILAMNQLRKEDRAELMALITQIKNATTEEEKKNLGKKAAEFIQTRGWGIFDSLVANGIIAFSGVIQ